MRCKLRHAWLAATVAAANFREVQIAESAKPFCSTKQRHTKAKIQPKHSHNR
jgi:hypothetical protein